MCQFSISLYNLPFCFHVVSLLTMESRNGACNATRDVYGDRSQAMHVLVLISPRPYYIRILIGPDLDSDLQNAVSAMTTVPLIKWLSSQTMSLNSSKSEGGKEQKLTTPRLNPQQVSAHRGAIHGPSSLSGLSSHLTLD